MGKEIKIEITSRNGHDEVTCKSVAEAKEIIQDQSQQGKWLYLDGKFTNFESLSDQSISDAQQIRLVSALQGG